LFKIIDTMMTLTKQLQAKLITKVNRLEEERKMPLVSPTEKMAIERGELIGERRLIIRLLNRRIGEIEPLLIKQVEKLDIEKMELLGEELLEFSPVADLERWLQNRPEIATIPVEQIPSS